MPPHLNPLPRGGEEVWADAQSGEATTMSILVYFRACPLTLILLRGGEEVQADAQSGEATTISNLVYFCACPLASIPLPVGERKFRRTRNPERQQRLAIWFISVRAPSPESSPPRGRGSLAERAIRRGNDYEHSGLLHARAPSPESSSPRGGEEVQADAQSGEATTISNLVYFCARPLSLNPSPPMVRLSFASTRHGRGSLGD